MSEPVTLPPDLPLESASDAALPPSQTAASIVSTTEPDTTRAPLALAPAAVPETQALLELIAHGLAPGADDATREAARDLWARFAQTMATAPVPPATPAMPAVPVMAPMPVPTSPLTMAARALRQLPPDQLLDLVLQRLRGALPAGATVPVPKGIQFQLVPVTPPGPP